MTAGTRALPRLIVPPGWAYLPVGADNAAAARALFAAAAAAGPRDSITPFLREAERAVAATLDDAYAGGAFAVALPLGALGPVPVSASIALSTVAATAATTATATTAATLPNVGAAVDTDAGPARRRIVEAPPATGDTGEVVLLRTIDYTWLHEGGYLLAFASISGLADPEYAPVTDAMTLLITTMLDALALPAPQAADRGGEAA